jgi:hypothetical protein
MPTIKMFQPHFAFNLLDLKSSTSRYSCFSDFFSSQRPRNTSIPPSIATIEINNSPTSQDNELDEKTIEIIYFSAWAKLMNGTAFRQWFSLRRARRSQG